MNIGSMDAAATSLLEHLLVDLALRAHYDLIQPPREGTLQRA
jgi:hypothetical protein